MDLTGFLNARLNEDEAAAKAAFGEVASGGEWQASQFAFIGLRGPAPTVDAHVARHDPARVLREVEAKRRILALHALTITKAAQPQFDPFTGDRIPDSYEVTCETCGWASDNPASGCPTRRALGTIWSGHPDYDPAWKD
jgi:Family of unknown function (DUF6221)